MTAVAEKPKDARTRPGGSWKGEFYRQCRAWHGYLSAFAFLALIFFALTGLLLNHPTWLAARTHAKPVETTLTLPATALAQAAKAPDQAKALAQAVGKVARLRGVYQSGEVVDDEALIRLEGVTGSSDLVVGLKTGAVSVTTERVDAVTTINELHRGKNAGAVWKLIIDVAAVVILALSIIGYVLFFSLRFRLRTSLILTGVSIGVLVAAFLAFVP